MQSNVHAHSKCADQWYGCTPWDAIYHLRSTKRVNDKYCWVDKLLNVNVTPSKEDVLMINYHLEIRIYVFPFICNPFVRFRCIFEIL